MIPVAKPALYEAEADAAREAVLSGWVTQGPQVAAFEREFAALVGAEHACAVSSCTTALHLALLAVGVQTGNEVITASHSYIATANAIRYCGGVPVFVDIEPPGFNLDPELVARAITPRTRAILCVHQIGMPCDLASLVATARQSGIALIEDAACAAGSEIRLDGAWEPIGRPRGDIACFSFHPRKLITTGDGGMLTTANAEWDRLFRLWRQHGMSVPDIVRHGSSQVIFEEYSTIGYNYRLTDVLAAVGRKQLGRLPDFVAERRALAANYHNQLSHIRGLELPYEPVWARSNWQSFCVRLPEWSDQREVMQHLLDAGIVTRRGIMCSHREVAYAEVPLRHPLPHSEQAQDRCILLPMYNGLSEQEQRVVVGALQRELI